jgi:hypothetical protein
MIDSKTLSAKGFSIGKAQFLPSEKTALKIAMDQAIPLITAANVSIPELFTTYMDPAVVEILTAPTNAQKIFSRKKLAEWSDTQSVYTEVEAVGRTQAYSDYGRGTTADVNLNFPKRDIERRQILVRVGDLEQDMAASAKINLLSQKQQAAARILNNDLNEIELFGVSGKAIYGLLNDPNLPSAISPKSVGGVTAWASKGAVGVYDDILALFAEISEATAGLVTFESKLVLAVPPAVAANLAQVTSLGVAPVMDMINAHFPNLRVETLAQLQDETGVQKVMLIAEEVEGKPTGALGYADLLRTSRVIEDYTAISQKWMGSSLGAFIYRPMAIAQMTGVQA